MNYNLGFVRIEVEDGIEYITDLYGEIPKENLLACASHGHRA